MEKLNIICSLFLLEFISDLLLLKTFHVRMKFTYLLFIQIPKICVNIICMELIQSIALKLFIKFVCDCLCVVFITESFKFKTLVVMIFAKCVFLFSVWGCFIFLVQWVCAFIEEFARCNVCERYNFLIILGLSLYIWCVFLLGKILYKNKKRKNFLAKLSLNLIDKHMSFYGLIDSGNSLRDGVTNKPVILISKASLLKHFSLQELDAMIYSCRKLSYNTVSGGGFIVPVLEIKKIQVETCDGVELGGCVLGFVDEKFENGKFDCLLPRDYL